MVHGNIQWIRGILPTTWKRNRVAAILALRRVFRMLWAWWGLSAAFGAVCLLAGTYADRAVTLPPALAAGIAALATGALASPLAARRFRDSALASLLSPFYYFTASESGERIGWT